MSEPERKIRLKVADLSKRRQDIIRILTPLVSDSDALYIHNTKKDTGEFVWVAVAKGESTQGDYLSKKFPITTEFQASYYEVWNRTYSGRREEYLYLYRAYLHFYRLNVETIDYDEYLLLHCDPNEEEDQKHWLYKQSPHLHLEFAPDPWPSAHLALNVGFLKEMLTDAASLTSILEGMVIMLNDQVLQHLRHYQKQR